MLIGVLNNVRLSIHLYVCPSDIAVIQKKVVVVPPIPRGGRRGLSLSLISLPPSPPSLSLSLSLSLVLSLSIYLSISISLSLSLSFFSEQNGGTANTLLYKYIIA